MCRTAEFDERRALYNNAVVLSRCFALLVDGWRDVDGIGLDAAFHIVTRALLDSDAAAANDADQGDDLVDDDLVDGAALAAQARRMRRVCAWLASTRQSLPPLAANRSAALVDAGDCRVLDEAIGITRLNDAPC